MSSVKLSEKLVYFSLAYHLGYTPAQVDDTDCDLIDSFMIILSTMNEGEVSSGGNKQEKELRKSFMG